ncbi:MAG: hypothetical protein RL885_16450 [Planctomycetota bacterium]
MTLFSETVELSRDSGERYFLRYFDRYAAFSAGDRLVLRGNGRAQISFPDGSNVELIGPADLEYLSDEAGRRQLAITSVAWARFELPLETTLWIQLRDWTLSGFGSEIVVRRQIEREIDVRQVGGNPVQVEGFGQLYDLQLGERLVLPDFYSMREDGPRVAQRVTEWESKSIQAPPAVRVDLDGDSVSIGLPDRADEEEATVRCGGSTVVLRRGETVRVTKL